MTVMYPDLPGVYLFKNKLDLVLYVGKANSLKKRIASYFQGDQDRWQIQYLLADYDTIQYIVTDNEEQALLLEAQLIQKYQPKYNILLKSGQPFVYIVITKDFVPVFDIVRNKTKKGMYFGPFLSKKDARGVYQYLLKTFRLKWCNKKLKNGCLDFHLGICAGNCIDQGAGSDDYLFRIELVKNILKNNHKKYVQALTEKMKMHADKLEFEKAQHLHTYVQNLDTIFQTIKNKYAVSRLLMQHASQESLPVVLSGQDTAQALSEYVAISGSINTIDCFDISHFQSRLMVGSCVRFTNGIPDKNKFRKFKIKTLQQQNDYAALQEIIVRRYKNQSDMPDLILIDGGKGQLSAVQAVLPFACPIISLAKQEETVFSSLHPNGKKLLQDSVAGKLLISLRDYAHHFAISYHKNLFLKGVRKGA